MNDPGLHEPIAAHANQVEKKYEDSDEDNMGEEEEVKSYLLPARWWYASTAFPLLAGTFGPMANTFSVCALVQYWRVEIPPGGTEAHGIDIKDPKWCANGDQITIRCMLIFDRLLAVNAISLIFALAANISLLLNMARRLSFPIAQPITILGFWIASVLLIALIAVASHDLRAPGVENQALTQAYYYAIFAAGLYQLISYLMCVTVWGAHSGHYSKEFKLTISQRTLMLQTISFMAYLLVGAAIYSHIEGWTFLDAIYWADFTCLTVGIGDYAPSTHLGRSLLFPYAMGGIVSLGLVVGSIRSMVLDRGKKKLHARMTEKTRKKILKRLNTVENNSDTSKVRGLDQNTIKTLTLDPKSSRASELERRRAEFDAMRKVQELAASKRKWISLCISGGVFLLLWVIGALVFYKAEKNQSWTYFGSLYFAYTSLLTIGYGDFTPYSNSGKPFFVFWSLLAVPSLTILISDMGDTVVKVIKDFTIYLGEITVLPSDQGGLSDRLKYGMHKVSGGKVGNMNGRQNKNNAKNLSNSDETEMSPGMAHMPSNHQRHGPNNEDVEAAWHVADDMEDEEKRGEEEANHRGDKIAEDVHHYRHLLISEIKKMYSYVNMELPKKFTYEEWSYFLRLLGEDEHDSRYHRRAPINGKQIKDRSEPTGTGICSSEDDENDDGSKEQGSKPNQFAKDKDDIREWSWLGNRSPLMGDKDEAEWILERLFTVLERDLRKQIDHQMHDRQHQNQGHAGDEHRHRGQHVHNQGQANKSQHNQGQSSSCSPPS
jgi:potassium channel subfamily K, other eukaryote